LLMHQFTAMTKAVNLVSGAAAGTLPSTELKWQGFHLARASGLGILILVVVTALSVYKPWGLTRYGRRKQRERLDQPPRSPQTLRSKTINDGLPQGLKIFLAAGIGVFLVVVLVSMHLTGHSLHHGH
jgi:IS4 transposase